MIGIVKCIVVLGTAVNVWCFGGISLNKIVSTNILIYSLRQKFISNIICGDKMMNHFEHPYSVVSSDVFYFTLFAGSVLLYINDEDCKNKYRKLHKSVGIPYNKSNQNLEIFIITSSLILAKDVNNCM